MSAVLGPIHYWLYNKIKMQDNLVEKIIKLAENQFSETDLRIQLDNNYGSLEKKPLEDMIDTSNIHGWLQERVTLVEYRLAYAVTFLLKNDPDSMDKLKGLFWNTGEEISASYSNNDAAEIFKNLNDILLDGMPCDHANLVISQDDKEVIWKRNICVHEDYWNEVGGDIKTYYLLREEFLKGFITGAGAVYVKQDETTSKITK
ncbi:hypothetical protein Ana3638_20415 [Anaerocolumna sedimenticola]|uniref:Uncharacterized protein n=1 Tax=Anaerocolumna sedimenticola TaxID=2696063 RepID=A0A6P1TNN7_9FIRM|nr:hypothetical protein [Anaerocolumna sedimenticola]QHQ62850.1 hypothetical protein Ana3638_20415 [Anaerocolumna sedimenticola]